MAGPVRVWDPLVRIVHWSLAASFAIAWLSADAWDNLHEWAGYSAAALVAVRVVWGFGGTRYARFSQFLRSPWTAMLYLRDMLRGVEPRYIGHNPAGSLMIMAILLTMGGLCLTGWLYTTDAYWGVEWVEETHEILSNTMLALVPLHVAGVIVASLRHRENLALAMLTGSKRAPEAHDVI